MPASARAAGQTIDAQRGALAAAVVDRQYAAQPELAHRYGPAGRQKCLQDAQYHLAYLAEAIAAEDPALFADYIAWAKVMLARRNVPAADLARHLEFLRETLNESLPAELRATAVAFIDHGLARLPQMPDELPSFLCEGAPQLALARDYLEALLRGERQRASRLILDAVRQGVGVKDLYLHVFQCTQQEIGRLWQTNQVSVAQEHYCTAATQLIMSQLYPQIFSTKKGAGTLVATCVAGELHEIGMRMVADFFEMDGWDTYYLGANTPTESVIRALVDRRAQVLGISATITYHVRDVEALVRAVRAAAACRNVKILVGGYPFNMAPGLWQKIGADGFARDAQGAIELAGRLVRPEGRA